MILATRSLSDRRYALEFVRSKGSRTPGLVDDNLATDERARGCYLARRTGAWIIGTLIYGNNIDRKQIIDHQLVHLKTIVLMKLRRNEPFALTVHDGERMDTRSTFWIHPAVSLCFVFDTCERVDMDRQVLESLMRQANGGEMTIDADRA
ncbi:hypothetical protein SAMN06295974_1895 [Plantibacter flavus]|uniref:DUF7882 domain-containing protein n=1 Tax=Plantibacter flavus TaxID=150123 RepID=A0A3N2BXJ6_9MICO|nr:hypothetical protein [Plantibacter flavus]ROR80001.1 hypothetical protein EDD42_0032 [Plantibacter flavus]SMG28391.1 hypothetical protein SAMN06295974_1895 [Plantibacter flavus]